MAAEIRSLSPNFNAVVCATVLIALLPRCAAWAALDGAVLDQRGAPIPGVPLVLFDTDFKQVLGAGSTGGDGRFALGAPAGAAYLVAQPAPVDDAGSLVWNRMPRIFAVDAASRGLALTLPDCITLTVLAYDAQGKLMTWSDFQAVSADPARFLYAADLDDRVVPFALWPVHGRHTGTTLDDPREKALPGILVAPEARVAIGVPFWPTAGYGTLWLRAGNAGKGFGGAHDTVFLNEALARTAVAELKARQPLFPAESHAAIAQLDTRCGGLLVDSRAHEIRAKLADGFLAEALRLRDDLEFARAQAAIPAARHGTLRVRIAGLSPEELAKCTVRATPAAADFLFGVYEGTERAPAALEALAKDGFNHATALLAWGWTEDPKSPAKTPWIDERFGLTRLHDAGMTLKAHGAVWLQGYGILPEGKAALPAAALSAQLIAHQQALIEAAGGKIAWWEAMNEPATTNVAGMPREAVLALIAQCARQARAAGKRVLVNSPHEFDFGGKYLIHNPDGTPRDDYPLTYSEFLDRAAASGALDAVDAIGLQCYPGYRLNTAQFAGQQGPAQTPAHILDTIARYARFGKTLHLTEFTTPDTYGPDWKSGAWRGPWSPEAQADFAERVYTLLYAHPQVHAITWWDALDDRSAVEGGGLIGRDGAPKPVLERLRALIAAWRTAPEAAPGPGGEAALAVAGGRYTVTVETPRGTRTLDEVAVWERWTRTLDLDFADPK